MLCRNGWCVPAQAPEGIRHHSLTPAGDGGNVEGLYKAFIDDLPQPAFCANTSLFAVRPDGTLSRRSRPSICTHTLYHGPHLAFFPPLLQLPAYQPNPGGVNIITLQGGKFCPTSQPSWSAFRQPTFGHGEHACFK